MIKVENIVGPSPEQWNVVVIGVRNPLNSWSKSDSQMYYDYCDDYFTTEDRDGCGFDELGTEIGCDGEAFVIGPKDFKLMCSLANAGTDHGKFMRQLPIICEITAPLYWWKQFDTYKIGTTSNSCSTMHTITKRFLTEDDFSFEWEDHDPGVQDDFRFMIENLNTLISCYNNRESKEDKESAFRAIIQMLPESFMQKRTVSLNYAVLKQMFKQRKNHKLSEWRKFFMQMFHKLPYAQELIVGE